MKSFLIIDIDGTLTISNPTQTMRYADWDDMFAHAKPNYPIISLIQAIQPVFTHTVIVTGREEKNRKVTVRWFAETKLHKYFYYDSLIMRENGDRRSNDLLKTDRFTALKHANPDSYMCVIDDNESALATAKSLGFGAINPNIMHKLKSQQEG